MKFEISKREPSPGDNTAWASTTQWIPTDDLQAEYHALAAAELQRRGVPEDVVLIEVAKLDEMPDGRAMYAVFLKVIAWRELPVVALLLGEGFLEASIRKVVRSTWLREASVFAGVWLRVSTRLQTGQAAVEMRRVLSRLDDGALPTEPALLR